ncbi:MAG: nucleoside monophosphate kinase [Candidatus Thermoplasmatota archaeon]
MDSLKEITLSDLKKPEVYGDDVDKVKVIQTHISYVFLTGEYAYKIKKPVDFGFLDFSTLEKRRKYCYEELKLNRRLCPEIYLDVVEIKRTSRDHLRIKQKGQTVEYAVKMKQFPQEKIMKNLIDREKIDKKTIETICEILIDFYKSDETSSKIKKYGEVTVIKKNTDENFEQTKNMIGNLIKKDKYDYIKTTTNLFLDKRKNYFKKRIENNHIHDCHGDLHSGNIVVFNNQQICIFDCIEFNKRFRYSDLASDIGFLAMDLDYQNRPYLSSHLIYQYVKKSQDWGIKKILNFYKCYRGYVRGKVTGFKLDDKDIPKEEKKDIKKEAGKYFDLSYYYSNLLNIDLCLKKPVLFLVGGMTGTGKTTLAKKISVDYNAEKISSDIIRKKIVGVDKYERHHEEINKGIYTPNITDKTYHEMNKIALEKIKERKNVVLDATFKNKEKRDKVRKLAEKEKIIFIPIECICPEETVKKWLKKRKKEKTVTDGRLKVYQDQKNTFESFKKEEKPVKLDMSKKSVKYRHKMFNRILKRIQEALEK